MKNITAFFFKAVCVCILLVTNLLQAEYSFTPHPDNKVQGRDCEIALGCVFQNEAPWLREWIEFHRLIGVQHFYLYNNLSTDHYLEILQPYLDSGVVEIYDYPASPLTTIEQPKIYRHLVDLAKGHNQWLAIIDTDEFITPVTADDLTAYLKTIPDDVGGIEVSWQCYGTSNVWSLMQDELLVEKLTLKAAANDPINQWFKSIVRPDCVKDVESAHRCSYLPGYRLLRVTPCAADMFEPPLNESSVKDIRVNHYVWRTKEFFYTVKVPRIKRWDINHFKVGSPVDYLTRTNVVEDNAIRKYIPALRSRVFRNPNLHEHGYWLGKETSAQHCFDAGLSSYLGQFFVKEKAASIADFGCGTGEYICAWREQGLNSEGFDGNPLTPKFTNGAGQVLDLSQPADLKKHYDWIVSLEVGQQIPKEFEANFIDNLVKHSDKGIVLSWAVKGQGGDFQINQHNNDEIKKMMADRGFSNDIEAEKALRSSTSLNWLKGTLMVFRKNQVNQGNQAADLPITKGQPLNRAETPSG